MSSPDFWTENPGLQANFFFTCLYPFNGVGLYTHRIVNLKHKWLVSLFFNLLFVYICLLLCWSNCPNIENDIRSTLHDRCWWKVGKSAFPYHQQSPVEPLAALGVAFVLSEVMSWAEYPVGLFNGQCVCVCVFSMVSSSCVHNKSTTNGRNGMLLTTNPILLTRHRSIMNVYKCIL